MLFSPNVYNIKRQLLIPKLKKKSTFELSPPQKWLAPNQQYVFNEAICIQEHSASYTKTRK